MASYEAVAHAEQGSSSRSAKPFASGGGPEEEGRGYSSEGGMTHSRSDSLGRGEQVGRTLSSGRCSTSSMPQKAVQRPGSRGGSQPSAFASPKSNVSTSFGAGPGFSSGFSSGRSRSSSVGSSCSSSPLRVQPPFCSPGDGTWARQKFQVQRPPHHQDWNDKFHLDFTKHGDQRTPNDLIQTGLRKFFSRPQSLGDLKESLLESGSSSHTASLVRALDAPEEKHKTTPFSADTAPSKLPTRHALGGTMKDRSKSVRLWNDRWHVDVGVMNDKLHPSQRQYFDRPSYYGRANSQSWRRYYEQEDAPGHWVPIEA